MDYSTAALLFRKDGGVLLIGQVPHIKASFLTKCYIRKQHFLNQYIFLSHKKNLYIPLAYRWFVWLQSSTPPIMPNLPTFKNDIHLYEISHLSCLHLWHTVYVLIRIHWHYSYLQPMFLMGVNINALFSWLSKVNYISFTSSNKWFMFVFGIFNLAK